MNYRANEIVSIVAVRFGRKSLYIVTLEFDPMTDTLRIEMVVVPLKRDRRMPALPNHPLAPDCRTFWGFAGFHYPEKPKRKRLFIASAIEQSLTAQ